MKEERKIDREAILTPDYTEEDIKIDRQLAITCHMLGFITTILGPLVFVLTKHNDAEFLKHHEREALNFQLTVLLLGIFALTVDLMYFKELRLLPALVIIDFFSVVSAVVKTKDEVFFKYPISIRFIPNPQQKTLVSANEDKGTAECRSKRK